MSSPSTAIDLRQVLDQLGLSATELHGKTALVTGAGRGIGLQAARAFGLLGAQVVIAEISPETGRSAEQILHSEASQALFLPTDVSSMDSVAALAQAVKSRFGRLDILVNNAIFCPAVQVGEMEISTWDQVIAVNLRGTFLVCKAFLPLLQASGAGVIINMVSTEAMPGLSAYIASKQGIAGFSQSLALETAASGVKVVPFAPGMVDTPAIRQIAGRLAPLLGMTEDAFLHLSLHPAYDGLMPPEHAGAATAYLAARCSDEYHGQIVNGYDILERAGFLRSALASIPAEPSEESIPDQPATKMEVPTLLDHLKTILDETEQEFGKLPIFVRPIARSGFKSKSGGSIEEWRFFLDTLGTRSSQKMPAPERAAVQARLEKLAGYYLGIPAETARFTKDREFLQAVVKTSETRVDCIRRLSREFA